MKTLNLGGVWQGHCETPGVGGFDFEARVPGNAYSDLQRIGRIENPFWRMNNQQNGWIEQSDFTYTCAFTAEETAPDAYLEFEGLDTFCTVLLNGKQIGEADDAHLLYRFPVGETLVAGENELEVRFRSAVREVADKPLGPHAFTGERIWIRRMQCTFLWDWVDRFVTCGVFRPCRLCYPAARELEKVYVRTGALDSFGARVDVTLDFATRDPDAVVYTRQTLTDPEGKTVWQKRRLAVEDRMEEEIEVSAPRLWWPNGYGEQPLYLYTVSLVNEAEEVLCEKQVRFGIRTVRLLQTEDAPDSPWAEKCRELKKQEYLKDSDKNETFARCTLIVNGQPVLLKGAAWVPCEPFTDQVTPERTRNLVMLAKEAHFTVIRVWGGGQFEDDAFFDACDEAGILITHDFLMACATYPEGDEWFMARLTEETRQGVERLRNHPCIAFWTGDNENAADGNENMRDYPGRRAALKAIRPVLLEADPGRPFVPGSPYGGVPNKSQTRGVTHNTFHLGDYGQYALDFRNGLHDMSDYRNFFEGKLARYIAEDPIMGAPMLSSLRKFMTEDDIFGEDKECWEFHTKNNPSGIFEKFNLFAMTEAYAEGMLGRFSGALDRVFKLQYMQYEQIRVTMENVRRNKWFSSAEIYWMFNDCWPASGWSLVDYYELPKAAWYGFKRAAAPAAASLSREKGSFVVNLCNDTLQPVNGKIRVRVQPTFRGEPRWERILPVTVAANSVDTSVRFPEQEILSLLEEDAVLVCDFATPLGYDRCFWLPKTPGDLRRPAPSVKVVSLTADQAVLKAETYAHAVALDGDYVFSDNYFMMLPGEERVIRFRKSEKHEKDGFELLVW